MIKIAEMDTSAVFVERLTRIIVGLLALTVLDMTPVWYQEIRKRPISYWVDSISKYTTIKAKAMLSSSVPPTITDIKVLDKVQTYNPGCYLNGLETVDLRPGHHDWVYVGSATAPGKGLDFRVHEQHEVESYRKQKYFSEVTFLASADVLVACPRSTMP